MPEQKQCEYCSNPATRDVLVKEDPPEWADLCSDCATKTEREREVSESLRVNLWPTLF